MTDVADMTDETQPRSRAGRARRMRRRADFLAAARGRFRAMPHIVVQMRDRRDGAPARTGFTATKRIGGAVIRNRARRRMREVARLLPPELLRAGRDYVFIARDDTAVCSFSALRRQAMKALQKLNAGEGRVSRRAARRDDRKGNRP